MNLSFRRMALGDVAQCHALPLLDAAAYDPATFARLPDLWRQLLADGGVIAWVVEDADRPPGARIVAMDIAVFVADDYIAFMDAFPPPYLSRDIVDRWRAGRSPLLGLAAVRRANAGDGLNMVCLHGAPPPSDREDIRRIHETHYQAYLHFCSGYRYKQLLVEVYGREQLQWNMNAGMRLIADPGTPAPPGLEPYLIGVTREEALEAFGSAVALLFRHVSPCFGFTGREQELLESALWGQSDDESAQALSLSVPAIRKRWQGIYEKVDDVSPDLLCAEAGESVSQKKRPLLFYLRSHPEELRPCARR